jgi:hypothetical protein
VSQVTCIGCSAQIDVSKADVTGRGYRCSQCSLKASVAAAGGHNDITDHLTVDERRARAKSALSEMIGGAAMAAFGPIVFLGFNGTVGVIVLCAGLGMMSHGFLTRREMRGQRTS